MKEHPITLTPPPELILEWCRGWNCTAELTALKQVATQAARWGADMELEACCEWMRQSYQDGFTADLLRSARRPKPPSLKEQALKELHHLVERLPEGTLFSDAAILRAIESLPD